MSDFWARRKAGVEAEEAEIAKAELEARETEARTKLEERSDDEILKELDLPDPDALEQGDDFAAFLKKTVPERIRQRALRRLWGLNPVLANLDGLVEYGEDFTDAATVVENLQTAYRVGEGMKRHVQEMARAKAEDEAEGEHTEVAAMNDTEPAGSAILSDSDDSGQELPSAEYSIPDQTSQDKIPVTGAERDQKSAEFADYEEENPMKPRRMIYHFDKQQS